MNNIWSLRTKMGLMASVVAAGITAALAGSASAAPPRRTLDPIRTCRTAANVLSEISQNLNTVLERQWRPRNVLIRIARLQFMADRINEQESRLASLPEVQAAVLSDDLVAALMEVRTEAEGILQDVQGARAADADAWPQRFVDAVNEVEDAAQAVIDFVDTHSGWLPA